MLDTAAGGNLLMTKDTDECIALFNGLAMSGCQRPPTRSTKSVDSISRGIHPVDTNTALTAQVEALTKMVKDLQVKSQLCEICRGVHDTNKCPVGFQEEAVDFISYPNQNQNSYNSGWRSNQNSNWRNGNQSSFQQHQSLFQDSSEGPSSGEKKPTLEEMMAHQTQMLSQLMTREDSRHKETQEKFREHETFMKNQGASIQNLERQMGDIASRLNERPPGTLPSNTEQNPKGFAKAEVTTVGVVEQPAVDGEEQVEEEIQIDSPPAKVHQRRSPASTAQAEKQSKPPLRVYKPKVPYPGRLQMDRDEEQNAKFLELLKQLHLNVPFLEALTQMPKYAKFLKDILTNKQNLAEVSSVSLSAGCSAVLQSKLPEKMADPGSFTIPCILGDDTVSHALADLGPVLI
ncbi:uncharacterized protein LOC143542665 [Bidens hawaiensis]|uniref:uncharacterized protein LOC143542665 n=1 Tax=Bidens hawaiensis TaxID=980011 RepID=UPI004049E4FA